MQHEVTAGPVTFGRSRPFVLIAGPCAIESRDHALFMADALVQLTTRLEVPFVFKSSFDKANRTSGGAARGVGMAKGLDILAEVKARHGCPVLTDIHERQQCQPVAEVVDILQIPAFLSRQTDLLVAAAETGAVVNVKKGQFLAPWDMKNVARKLEDAGAKGILLTDRGTSFGYNTLVTDFRGLTYLEETGWPVVFDATHSVQQPGGQGGASGGERRFVPLLARAAVALGVASVFIESHD
ncbi:3-deoxy-8-phosphooctulonate synthase, partial [Geminicoccus harenae]